MNEQDGPEAKESFMRSSRVVSAFWSFESCLSNLRLGSATAFPNSRVNGLTKGMSEEQSSRRGTLTFLTPLSSDVVKKTKTEHSSQPSLPSLTS